MQYLLTHRNRWLFIISWTPAIDEKNVFLLCTKLPSGLMGLIADLRRRLLG